MRRESCQLSPQFRPCRFSRLRRFRPQTTLWACCIPLPTMGFVRFQAVGRHLAAPTHDHPHGHRPFGAFPSQRSGHRHRAIAGAFTGVQPLPWLTLLPSHAPAETCTLSERRLHLRGCSTESPLPTRRVAAAHRPDAPLGFPRLWAFTQSSAGDCRSPKLPTILFDARPKPASPALRPAEANPKDRRHVRTWTFRHRSSHRSGRQGVAGFQDRTHPCRACPHNAEALRWRRVLPNVSVAGTLVDFGDGHALQRHPRGCGPGAEAPVVGFPHPGFPGPSPDHVEPSPRRPKPS
jgi:hypothetical protein